MVFHGENLGIYPSIMGWREIWEWSIAQHSLKMLGIGSPQPQPLVTCPSLRLRPRAS